MHACISDAGWALTCVSGSFAEGLLDFLQEVRRGKPASRGAAWDWGAD